MNIDQIINVFRDVTNHDTLHDSIAEDVEDTQLNKNNTPRARDMPNMGFHYILDTNHYTLAELEHIAATYRLQLDNLNAIMETYPEAEWRTWDILKYITGSDNLVAPPGVAVVTHDTIDSYAYPTISEYAQDNTIHTID